MRITLIFALVAFSIVSCSKFAKVQKSTDYDYKLRMAEKYYVAKKYHFAQQFLEALPLGTPAPSIGAEPDGHERVGIALFGERRPRRRRPARRRGPDQAAGGRPARAARPVLRGSDRASLEENSA